MSQTTAKDLSKRNRAANESHFGLSGMRERVSAVGGTFEVESRLGGGTVLSARIPIDEAS